MDLSLNEVESLAQKAARGGGLAWGLADDAGRSARWLAARGFGWADGLLALLDAPPAPAQCPIRLGGFLADLAGAGGRQEFAAVAQPLWLISPALEAAARHGRPLSIRFDGALWRPGLGLARVTVAPEPAPPAPRPVALRAALPAALAARLDAYAARTYVPASAQSRALGAGAGLRDTD